VLSPVIDLARDPRWGRTEETYGEDPHLVSEIGLAAIRGYQGPMPTLTAGHVFATAKHYAAHGPNEGGINTAPDARCPSASCARSCSGPSSARSRKDRSPP
jgi:beta-glucosidase